MWIYTLKGPYGFYIEMPNEPKPKRTQLPKNIAPEDLGLDTAIKLILPVILEYTLKPMK